MCHVNFQFIDHCGKLGKLYNEWAFQNSDRHISRLRQTRDSPCDKPFYCTLYPKLICHLYHSIHFMIQNYVILGKICVLV